MQTKPKKTREEKISEEFFPLKPENLKQTIEKQHKEIEENKLVEIEKIGEKLAQKKEKTKKIASKKNLSEDDSKKINNVKEKVNGKSESSIKNFHRQVGRININKRAEGERKSKEFKIPKIALKRNGYELIITEKPQAALKIASALGDYKTKKINSVSHYELERNGKKILVACAVGHLFTLASKEPSSKVPSFDLMWLPNYAVKKSDFTKKYLSLLINLVKNAGEVTIATDYDVEGELIGFNIMKFAAGLQDANRMKFSTLTEKEINQSYEEKSKTINWGQAVSGETRHILDWYYGINISRLLMRAIKTTGKFRIFSIGRIQGPTLKIIVKKEKEIQDFKSKKYWQVFIKTEKPEIELVYHKDIFDKKELNKFENLIGKKGKAITEKIEQNLPPNPPFNLTNLQTEAYYLYGINPAKTLEIAQSLYLTGLISYPRTSSQKLPPSINYKEIISKLAKEYKLKNLLTRTKPIEGNKSDPAHPSIYPTGNLENLSGDEQKIFDLIVRRFLCLFAEDAIIENKKIKLTVNIKEMNKVDANIKNSLRVSGLGGGGEAGNTLIFVTKGFSIKKISWMDIYPKKIKEKELPDLNGEVKIKEARTEEKETMPPKRYTQASLISELEKRNLGTKATRAMILETLYDRSYIKDQSIKATPLGISLIQSLEKHSPIITDEALTKEFEKDMEIIQNSKKNYLEKETKIIEKAKKTIEKISEQFKKEEKEIGKDLLEAVEKLNSQTREANILNGCPECHHGNLTIVYSKKNKKYFIACTRYPECKKTYSLPPNGLMKRSKNICEKCGFRKVLSIRKGKKPWELCFNVSCPTNKERLEKYKANKERNINENL